MTVTNTDRDALAHGKITEQPLRKKPALPTWAIKIGMAVTGLLFSLFLLVHMIGNLKIFLPVHEDGVRPIDEYAEFLRTVGEPLFPREGILWILRIVLLASLIFHVYGAFALKARSKKSRGKFARTNLMGGWDSFATRTMVATGGIILLFIIFHILDLTIGVQPAATEVFEHGEAYANLVASFSRWPVALFYIFTMVVIFAHVSHGIWLATNDLGISGHKTRAAMQVVAYLLPALVLIGNTILPLAVLFGWVS